MQMHANSELKFKKNLDALSTAPEYAKSQGCLTRCFWWNSCAIFSTGNTLNLTSPAIFFSNQCTRIRYSDAVYTLHHVLVSFDGMLIWSALNNNSTAIAKSTMTLVIISVWNCRQKLSWSLNGAINLKACRLQDSCGNSRLRNSLHLTSGSSNVIAWKNSCNFINKQDVNERKLLNTCIAFEISQFYFCNVKPSTNKS